MPSSISLERLLDRLEAAKRQFGTPEQADLPRLLAELGRRHFSDAAALIRFHEALLFFRAYPPSEEIRESDGRTAGFVLLSGSIAWAARTATWNRSKNPTSRASRAPTFSAIFSYDIARWLAARHRTQTEIDWDAVEPELLGPLLKRLHPMFDEDALVEANIPYEEWFRAAKTGRGSDLQWLFANIERLRLAPELFEHARLPIRWRFGNSRTTRTNLRLPGRRKTFFHDGPLLQAQRRIAGCGTGMRRRSSWNG